MINKDIAHKNKVNDPLSYIAAKKDLRSAIKKKKSLHKEKLEEAFDTKDAKKMWGNISKVTNYKGPTRSVDTDDETLPDRLNDFYARFDRDNKTTPAPLPVSEDEPPPFIISDHDVRCKFKRQKKYKSCRTSQY